MKREKLADALNYIRGSFVADAAAPKKTRRIYWLGAIAAVLAIVIFFQNGHISMAISASAVAIASESRVTQRPDIDDYESRDEWRADNEAWMAVRDNRAATVSDLLQTCSFLTDSSAEFLSGAGSENRVWSPINGYIALAMLAETSSGDSRRQILEALNADSMETLRSQVSAVWETVYRDDGHEISVLANSFWLDNDLDYSQEIMDNLAYYHYASVYQGDFGTGKTDKALQTWLNNNTAGLLSDSINRLSLPEDTVLALASTIYFQSKWSDQFKEYNNTRDIFHAPEEDITCTFMNQKEMQTDYYWGESFGAVSLWLKNNSRMWLILPDEDKSVEDVLSEGQYMKMITDPYAFGESNGKYMKVNLSLPKFDVGSSMDLRTGLEHLGITDVFDIGRADFTQAVQSKTNVPVHITSVNQAIRVLIDEEGVKAAAYIQIPGAGAAMPPEEIIDFVLDRPFLFVIADSSGLPLFTGVVNAP